VSSFLTAHKHNLGHFVIKIQFLMQNMGGTVCDKTHRNFKNKKQKST